MLEGINKDNFYEKFGAAIIAAKTQQELDEVCKEFKAIADELGIENNIKIK